MLRRLLALVRHPEPDAAGISDVYRSAPADDPKDLLDKLGARLASQQHEIRMLRRRLGEQGIPEPPSVSSRELLEAAEVLEHLSRGDAVMHNTVRLRMLAAAIRLVATYDELGK